MPSKERNPWEANNETKVVFFSRTVCTKLLFYVIFRAICHFLGTISSLSFSNKKKKEGHNDLYITALTMHGPDSPSTWVSFNNGDFIFLSKLEKLEGTFSLPQGFYCSSQFVHQRIFIFQCFIVYDDPCVIHSVPIAFIVLYMMMYRLYTAPFDTEHVSNSLIIKMGKLGPRDRMTCLHRCSASGLQDSTGLKVDYTVESLVKLERFITNLSLIFPMSKWENTYLAGLFQGFSMKIPPPPSWNVIPLLSLDLLSPYCLVSNFTSPQEALADPADYLRSTGTQDTLYLLLHYNLVTVVIKCVGNLLCSLSAPLDYQLHEGSKSASISGHSHILCCLPHSSCSYYVLVSMC